MKEKICCVYDDNEKYALKLAEYVNGHHVMPFKALVYTSKEALQKCTEKYEIELLVVSGMLTKEEILKIGAGTVVVLYDLKPWEDSEFNYVCKYQPADHLVKEIMSYMSGFTKINEANTNITQVCCIYSPATKCFKTTIALGLALYSASRGRSLYLGLEQFSGLSKLLSSKEGGLSEALYCFKSGGTNSIGKIISCTGQISGMDYFYPVTCAEDISEMQEKEFLDFLNMIINSGVYKYIWIDVGCVYNSPWRLMEISDRVIMPKAIDYMGANKISEMENYLMVSGREELLNKIEKIDVVYDETVAGYEITIDLLRKHFMVELARELLEVNSNG